MRVYAVKKILQSTPLCYNKPYNKKSGNNRVFPSGHNIRRHPKENAMRANNLTLLTDLYELTMMQGYFKNPTNQTVVFDACSTATIRAMAVLPSVQDWSR